MNISQIDTPPPTKLTDASEASRARQLFHNKKSNPDFRYFAEKGVEYFVSWFLTLDKRCCYCEIEEHKLRELFQSGRLSTKRKRGKSLELERYDSKTNQYTEANCALACYFCNNHKSDIISRQEHKAYFATSIKAYLDDLHGQEQKVTDSSTDFLYLSDRLPHMYPAFYQRLSICLETEGVAFGLLEGTKDIWAVDYMPIQMTSDRFIQFAYNPDYLREYKTYRKSITDTTAVCELLGLSPVTSNIIVDGGNIVRCKSKAIMTSKVFAENPTYKPADLIAEIERLLELRVVIVPMEPKDWIGHADGMVRFLDENTVLLNDYSKESKLYYTELRMSLRNAGLDIIDIPYNPYPNQSDKDATGVYVNYLQMKDKVFLPVFGLDEDERTYRLVEQLFVGQQIVPVKSNEIAKQGGVLNCISWNILRQ